LSIARCLRRRFRRLKKSAAGENSDSRNIHGLVVKLKEIVPEYKPSREIPEQAEVDSFDKSASYNRARAGLSL
jgi:hypothetical protein